MPSSRLRIETKAITEGALMAALTAILAMAGILIPFLSPVVMLIWTLPVVVVCIRHGMRVGIATIAVAGFIIMSLGTPFNALDMLLTSTGPALLIGCGFYYKWPTEKTLLFAAISAVIGLAAVIAISIKVMGISLQQFFGLDPETIEQVIIMINESGLLSSAYESPESVSAAVYAMIDVFEIFFPVTIAVYGLLSALSNYLVAHVVLRKLKVPVPPLTKLATFRLPMPLVIAVVLSLGMTILGGMYFAEYPIIVVAGQNVQSIMLVLYAFQGFGVISFFLSKMQPQARMMSKAALVFGILATGFNLLGIIGYVGVFDAFADIRRLDKWTVGYGQEKT